MPTRFRGVAALLLMVTAAASAATPSFVCARAKGWLQTTICASERLSELDLQLAVAYARMLRVTSGVARHSLEDEQRAWSASRNDCRSASEPTACLENRYEQQIAALESRPAYPGEHRSPPPDLPPEAITEAGHGWTRDLSRYQRAIRACREEAPDPISKALVVWRAGDDGTLGLRLVDWQRKEWVCMAHADGHKVFDFRLRDPNASLPEAGPVYHLDPKRPPGCRAATQVLDINGKPAGWISDTDC